MIYILQATKTDFIRLRTLHKTGQFRLDGGDFRNLKS